MVSQNNPPRRPPFFVRKGRSGHASARLRRPSEHYASNNRHVLMHRQTKTPPVTLAVSGHGDGAGTSVVLQFVHQLHRNETAGTRHRSTGTTEVAPPSLRWNAPNIMRKASHLYSQGMTAGGGQAAGKGWRDRRGTANAVRNAVSRSWFSQPKPYLGGGGGASVHRRCGAVKKE